MLKERSFRGLVVAGGPFLPLAAGVARRRSAFTWPRRRRDSQVSETREPGLSRRRRDSQTRDPGL